MHGFCAHTRCRGGWAGCSGAFVGAGRWCACCRGGRLLVLCSSLTPGFVQAQSLSIWDRKSLRGTDDLFLCPSHDTCRWSYRSPSSGLFSDGLRGSGCAVSCLSSRYLAGVEITGRVLQAEDGDVTTCPRRHGGERWGRTLRCTFRSRPRTPPLGSSSFSPQTPGRLPSTRSGGLSVAPFSFRPPSRQCIFGAGGLLSAPVRDARRAERGWPSHEPSCRFRSGVPQGAPLLQSASPAVLAERWGHGAESRGRLLVSSTLRHEGGGVWGGPRSFLWLALRQLIVLTFPLHPIRGRPPSQAASRPLLGYIILSLLVLLLGSWFTPGKCSISKRSSDFLKCNTCR